jgi:hypothetical protein
MRHGWGINKKSRKQKEKGIGLDFTFDFDQRFLRGIGCVD